MTGLFHTIEDRERPCRGPGRPPGAQVGSLRRAHADGRCDAARSSVRMFGCGCSAHHHYMVRVKLWGGFAENKIKSKTKQTITFKNGDSDKSGGTMSKVQGGMKCVKYLLFVFNSIFWVSP